jgi:cytosine/adenosine deaminase-related metal-dependent hydrolase
MLLNGTQPVNIAVSAGRIVAIGAGKRDETDQYKIHFTEALAIPGLINSHDHLDFNCFPIFGERKYNNYTEWGNHIQKTYRDQIDAILKIPRNIRASWGMYKNLVAGITTVVNHGSFLKITNPLINIYQEPQNLHSVRFEKKWKWKLNNPLLKNKDCVIHTGEGVDEQSYDEIDELLKYNLLKRNLIGVHGVAMNAIQAKGFKGLVWCPESNRVLLDRHADIKRLKAHSLLVFGTDSTLTGNWNIWQHLRLARSLEQVSDEELFSMVTSSPAKLWNMHTGELAAEKEADILIVKKKSGTARWDDFFRINPEDILMILHKGKIRMFDKTMFSQLNSLYADLSNFSQISVHGVVKFVEGDLRTLISSIRDYNHDIVLPFDIYTNG